MENKYKNVPSVNERNNNLWDERQKHIQKHSQKLIDVVEGFLYSRIKKYSDNIFHICLLTLNEALGVSYKFDSITAVYILKDHFPENIKIKSSFMKCTKCNNGEHIEIIINPKEKKTA